MGQDLSNLNIQDTYQSLVQISGSFLTDGTGSILTSANISASYATIANTASYATTALSATSASYATTASFALNGGGGSVDTGSLLTTASISNDTITFTKGDASTFNIVVNNVSNASTASIATFATSAGTASLANTATLAVSASHATTASYALNVSTPDLQQITDIGATTTNTIQVSGSAGVIDLGATDLTYTSGDNTTSQTIFFQNSGFTNTANITFNPSSGDLTIGADGVAQFNGNALTADSATSASYALSASYADTASHALGLADGLNLNVANLTASGITTTNLTATSASIGYLQTITGSATIIGDAFILLNTSNATRYAGLLVEDSGSSTPINYTASWYFDSQLNDWNYEYTTTSSTDFAVALFAPAYNTKGSPTYLTANTIPKAEGTHHLVDSNISDDGSSVNIASNALVSTIGATADLVITSDDDFTYQSTLRIGGGSGGAGNSFYLTNFNDTSSITTDNGLLSISLGGTLQLQGLNYPATDGNAGEFLATDGVGNLSFITASAPTSASYATTASFAVSASYATTASSIDNNDYLSNLTDTYASVAKVFEVITLTSNEYTASAQNANTLYIISDAEGSGAYVSGSLIGNVEALTITSNTASMDCSTSNFFTLALQNGIDTSLDATNVQAGQTINLRVVNNGTSAGTLSFNTSIFKFEGGTPFVATPTTSAIDIMTFISFDSATLQATGLKNFS